MGDRRSRTPQDTKGLFQYKRYARARERLYQNSPLGVLRCPGPAWPGERVMVRKAALDLVGAASVHRRQTPSCRPLIFQ